MVDDVNMYIPFLHPSVVSQVNKVFLRHTVLYHAHTAQNTTYTTQPGSNMSCAGVILFSTLLEPIFS